jgi:hypothetical protein
MASDQCEGNGHLYIKSACQYVYICMHIYICQLHICIYSIYDFQLI